MTARVHSLLALMQGSHKGLSKFRPAANAPATLRHPFDYFPLPRHLLICATTQSNIPTCGFSVLVRIGLLDPGLTILNSGRWVPGVRELAVEPVSSPQCTTFAFRCGVFWRKVLNMVPRLASVAEVDEYHAIGITPRPGGVLWRRDTLKD